MRLLDLVGGPVVRDGPCPRPADVSPDGQAAMLWAFLQTHAPGPRHLIFRPQFLGDGRLGNDQANGPGDLAAFGRRHSGGGSCGVGINPEPLDDIRFDRQAPGHDDILSIGVLMLDCEQPRNGKGDVDEQAAWAALEFCALVVVPSLCSWGLPAVAGLSGNGAHVLLAVPLFDFWEHDREVVSGGCKSLIEAMHAALAEEAGKRNLKFDVCDPLTAHVRLFGVVHAKGSRPGLHRQTFADWSGWNAGQRPDERVREAILEAGRRRPKPVIVEGIPDLAGIGEGLPPEFADLLKEERRLQELWAGHGLPPATRTGRLDESASRYDYAVLRQAVDWGIDDPADLARILWLRPNGSARKRERGDAEHYLRKTVSAVLQRQTGEEELGSATPVSVRVAEPPKDQPEKARKNATGPCAESCLETKVAAHVLDSSGGIPADMAWHGEMMEEIERRGCRALFDLELKAAAAAGEMTARGIGFDRGRAREGILEIGEELSALRPRIPTALDPTDDGAVRACLFETLGLPPVEKTKDGLASVSEEALSVLRHPAADAIGSYRRLHRLAATLDRFMEGAKDGRVHSGHDSLGTETGRFTCSGLNVQSVARNERLRGCFVAKPGHLLVVADFSQLELRVLAALSKDGGLLGTLGQDDPFSVMGSELFPGDADGRGRAKVLTYSIIYGQTPWGLAKAQGWSVERAQSEISAWLDRYPEVYRFLGETGGRACENGWATTLMGRRRRLPDPIRAGERRVARMAASTAIQGTAAELCKAKLVGLNENLPAGSELVATIHDEFIIETPVTNAGMTAIKVKEMLESNWPLLDVPLRATVGVGTDWAAAGRKVQPKKATTRERTGEEQR